MKKKKGKVEIRFDRRVAIVVVESGVNFFSSGTSLYATAHIQTFVLLQRRKRDLGKEKKSNKSRRSRSHTLGRRPSYTPVSDRKKNINKKKRNLSPTNCSSAATGVSRGYGQDPRSIFFFFLSLIVGACCWLRRAANQLARFLIQAPPPRPLRGRRLLRAPTWFFFSFMFNRCEPERARSSQQPSSYPTFKKKKKRREKQSHPPSSWLCPSAPDQRVSNVRPVFIECGLLCRGG